MKFLKINRNNCKKTLTHFLVFPKKITRTHPPPQQNRNTQRAPPFEHRTGPSQDRSSSTTGGIFSFSQFPITPARSRSIYVYPRAPMECLIRRSPLARKTNEKNDRQSHRPEFPRETGTSPHPAPASGGQIAIRGFRHLRFCDKPICGSPSSLTYALICRSGRYLSGSGTSRCVVGNCLYYRICVYVNFY